LLRHFRFFTRHYECSAATWEAIERRFRFLGCFIIAFLALTQRAWAKPSKSCAFSTRPKRTTPVCCDDIETVRQDGAYFL